MATPCSNCVYRGTKYCAIFCGRWWAVAFFLFAIVSGAWGACVSSEFRSVTQFQCSAHSGYCDDAGSTTTCPTIMTSGGMYWIHTDDENWSGCYAYNYCQNQCGWNNCKFRTCYYRTSCDTQAEADSVRCAQDPTLEGCVVEIDTTLFACTDNISGNGGLYRLACKATNGVVTSCNGKTNVDIATDGTLVRPLQGTCSQNGFNTGVIGGATSDSTAPQSANADCFAIVGSTCHMKDKASGNTFRCECDGSCNVALRNLMAGNADCTNPYEQPEQSDSLDLPLSSPSSSPSSSGSGRAVARAVARAGRVILATLNTTTPKY